MKLPKIPFLNRKKRNEPNHIHVKRRQVNTSPDEDRIKREVSYENRLLKGNSRVNRLQQRASLQKGRKNGR